jgi:hypothetical protein
MPALSGSATAFEQARADFERQGSEKARQP